MYSLVPTVNYKCWFNLSYLSVNYLTFEMKLVLILLCLALYLDETQAQIFCLGRPRSKTDS